MLLRRRRIAFLLGFTLLLLLPACDWVHYALMNSIPFHGRPERNPDVYVYMGLDGLAHRSVLAAQKQGVFTGANWKLAKFVSMFPATSDASWTRILHTSPIGGYEFQYFNPVKDKIVNPGLLGLALHVLPNIADPINLEAEYLQGFDYSANGYLHSVGAYHDTYENLGESIDNIFFLLEGRAETQTVFSAYLIEFDVLGHMQTEGDVTRELVTLGRRIEDFRSKHPERRFHFTLFSDHGMDFIKVPKEHLVELDKEMPKVGVTPVDSLLDHDPKHEIFAVPIQHTRVTYIALHTNPEIAPEVAARLSRLESIDLSMSRVPPPDDWRGAVDGPPLEWFGIWAEGKPALTYGFDPKGNRYYVPARRGKYARLDLPLALETDENEPSYRALSDEAGFALSKDRDYPDLFYRIRTSFAPIGAKYPADVFVSFRPGYVSKGFQLPGTDDIATSAFHGSLHAVGSVGTLLSEERALPDAVREDDLLQLFPRMKEHMEAKGLRLQPGDPYEALHY